MNVAESIGISLVCSVLVAAGVFFFTILTRPKIKISPVIAVTRNDETRRGAPSYRFKIVNLRRRAAVDIRISAYLDKPQKVPGASDEAANRIHLMKVLGLNSSQVNVLHGRRKSSNEARHAFRVRFDDDIEAIWTDEQKYSITVRIFARDSWTGAIKEFERSYELRKCIKEGTFKFGDSFDVA